MYIFVHKKKLLVSSLLRVNRRYWDHVLSNIKEARNYVQVKAVKRKDVQ